MVIPPIASRLFVGRRDELESLSDCRRAAALGQGCVVLVEGEAGIGKSRLLAQFQRSIAGPRAPHLAYGECLEHAPRPYGPFRTIASALIGKLPTADGKLDGPARRSLSHLTADRLESSGGLPERDELEKADVFAGFAIALERIGTKHALILVIEDLHWADPATLELLTYVARRVAGKRVLIVATYRNDELYRDHPAMQTLAQLRRERTVHRIALGGLAPVELRALVNSALESRASLPAATLRTLERRSEGNPFFAEELLKEALEAVSPSDEAVPFSIRAAVAKRLGRLSDESRECIRLAALLGDRFEPQILARVAECDVAELAPTLERAHNLQLIVEDRAEPTRYRFRHALTRQAIANEMLAVQARPLHARIAKTLEAMPDSAERVDELAYHWWKARDFAKALDYNERAGERAMELRAYADAETYFERALEIAQDEVGRARLLERLGDAATHGNELLRGQRAHEMALELRIAQGEYARATRLACQIAGGFYSVGEFARAVAHLEGFAEEFGAQLHPKQLAEVRIAQAVFSQTLFDPSQMLQLLAQVTIPIEDFDVDTRRKYWLAKLAAHAQAGELAEWKVAAQRLRDEFGAGTPRMLGRGLEAIGLTAVLQGEGAAARAAFEAAIASFQEWRLVADAAAIEAMLALYHLLYGELEKARELLTAALAAPESFLTRFHLMFTGPFAAIALADDDLMSRCLSDDLERQAQGRPDVHAFVLGSRSAVIAARGDVDGARTLLHEAVDELQTHYATILLLPLAARYVDESHLSKVRSIAGEAARNPQNRVMQATSALVEAIAMQRGFAEGDRVAQGRLAAERYRDLGWPLFEAQALELAGDETPALALYRRCRSVADVRRLELGPRGGRPSSDGVALSDREREVALLVARGLSNRAIADALCVSVKTIEKHVSSIFLKLGFHTRMELAMHIAAER